LNKPGSLNEKEWETMRQHPEIAKNIIKNIEGLEQISECIKNHHERIDGNGYYKVNHEKLSEISKIIAVADTFSAITTERPYREKRTIKEAKKILKEVSGFQLENKYVDVILMLHEDELKQCLPEYLN